MPAPKIKGKEDHIVSINTYEIKAKGKEAEIWLYEEIGYSFFGDGITAKQFAKDLKDLGKIDKITLRINSPGGDVFDGTAIYNTLKQHSAKVIVYIDGLAASIASVIAMAGDEILMAENAMMMIHNAWGICIGNANDMRDTAERLEKINGSIIKAYQSKSNISFEDITELLNEESWLNAEEAKSWNLITGIVEELQLAAHYDLTKFRFRNIPKLPKAKRPKPKEVQSPDPATKALWDRIESYNQKYQELIS